MFTYLIEKWQVRSFQSRGQKCPGRCDFVGTGKAFAIQDEIDNNDPVDYP